MQFAYSGFNTVCTLSGIHRAIGELDVSAAINISFGAVPFHKYPIKWLVEEDAEMSGASDSSIQNSPVLVILLPSRKLVVSKES